MMGVFCMTAVLVSSLPSCGEGGHLLGHGSPACLGHPRGLWVLGTILNAITY